MRCLLLEGPICRGVLLGVGAGAAQARPASVHVSLMCPEEVVGGLTTCQAVVQAAVPPWRLWLNLHSLRVRHPGARSPHGGGRVCAGG